MSDSIPVRLAISHYLRTLRERDEFDRLLPELLTEMGYIPLVRPKAGVWTSPRPGALPETTWRNCCCS
jgi:hypothetical protein